MLVKGVVDQRVTIGFNSPKTDPVDVTTEFTVKPLGVPPPPPPPIPLWVWALLLGVPIIGGVIYFATRK